MPRILRRDPILGSTGFISEDTGLIVLAGYWTRLGNTGTCRVELGSEILVDFLNPNISGFGYHLRYL